MIRSPDNKIEVAWVPKRQLREALNVFKEFIYRGLENDDQINIGELVIDLFNGDVRMGVIYEVSPFLPVGSWFSDIRVDEEQNYDYATIYGLSGKSPNKWAVGIKTLLEDWCRENDCYSYRWYGRLGWSRYGDNVNLLRQVGPREGLFEKVV